MPNAVKMRRTERDLNSGRCTYCMHPHTTACVSLMNHSALTHFLYFLQFLTFYHKFALADFFIYLF